VSEVKPPYEAGVGINWGGGFWGLEGGGDGGAAAERFKIRQLEAAQ